MFATSVEAQEVPVPVETIERLLGVNQSTEAIMRLFTEDRCRAFPLNAETVSRLEAAGAQEDLIAGLREVSFCGGEEPEPEETPVPVVPLDSPPTEPVLYSPGSAAMRSLAIPGLGQFYTGQPALGGLFLAGWAGAIGFGVMSQETTVECLSPTTDACPAGQVRGETVTRPNLIVGLGAAAALAITSALHARSAATKANVQSRSPGDAMAGQRFTLVVLPAQQSGRTTEFVLVQLRF